MLSNVIYKYTTHLFKIPFEVLLQKRRWQFEAQHKILFNGAMKNHSKIRGKNEKIYRKPMNRCKKGGIKQSDIKTLF